MKQILGNRILVFPPTTEELTTKSGIVVTNEKVLSNIVEGEVHAWGNGDRIPNLKSGDKILYAKSEALPINIEGTDYILVDVSNVYCVLGF